MTLPQQAAWLFLLALPIACASWTVTHEEVFREPREWCKRCSEEKASLLARKFFYLFTCEYCFSHYMTLIALAMTRFQFLVEGWRGYVLAEFALVWVANTYMTIFGLLRTNIVAEKTETNVLKEIVEEKKKDGN